jgi:hypothetical protein
MIHTVISGDIIASTSLSAQGKMKIENNLFNLINELEDKFDVFGRVLKGDYIECYVPNPKDALRVMLIIKGYLKSIALKSEDIMNLDSKKIKFFKTHVIRLAMGVGKLNRLELDKGIIDGEAIYLSGRTVENEKTHNKKKVIIRNTLFLRSSDNELENEMSPLIALIDFIMTRNTAKQSQVLYLKLMGLNEEDIVEKMKLVQSTINQHSTNAGWLPISKAILRFEKVLQGML